MAGSPYKIYNNIDIPVDSTLQIDPGVEVVFQGLYHLRVHGHLIAAGTATSQINFHAQDTTGWYNDASPAGGWRGIFFDPYTSTGPDKTTLEYCNLSDMKYGGYGGVFPGAVIETYRPLYFKHCNFFHNQMVTMNGQCIFQGNMQAGKFQLESCDIHDNQAFLAIISVNNYPAGNAVMNLNKMHHNTAIDVIFSQQGPIDISKNEIYQNDNTGQGGSIIFLVTNSVGKIYENKIHHNTNTHVGPIFCNNSDIDITGNLITNNSNSLGWCHFTDGGAGIMLEVGKFTVRNNIIANNYTNYTGGGLKIYEGDAYVVNNTFINNSSGDQGPALHIQNMTKDVRIKNNIFHSNERSLMASDPTIYVASAVNIEFDYNFINRPLTTEMFKASGTFIGSTTHNVVLADPMLMAPTTAANPTLDATIADFRLKPGSPCINAGDSAHAQCYPTDYAGNPRVAALKVDIGAYEVPANNPPVNGLPASAVAGSGMSVYPNPATTNLFINIPSAAGMIQVKDVTSKVVFEQQVNAEKLNIPLSGYAAGVYFITWNDDGKSITQKVLVK
jgi:hypothetical protein